MNNKDLFCKIDHYGRIYVNDIDRSEIIIATLEKLMNRLTYEAKQTIEENIKIINHLY